MELREAVIQQVRFERRVHGMMGWLFPVREDIFAPRHADGETMMPGASAFRMPQYDQSQKDVVSVLAGWFRPHSAHGLTRYGPSDERDVEGLSQLVDLTEWHAATGDEKARLWNEAMRQALSALELL